MVYNIYPLSDNAILIQFAHENYTLKEQIQEVQKAIYQINQLPFDGFIELVPAYNTITIYYNPYIVKGTYPFQTVKSQLNTILNSLNSTVVQKKSYFEIPVCYEGENALDLGELAASKKLTVHEVVQLHCNAVYDVIFIGFSPGFPFLDGLDHRLHFPRKTNPRLKVKQGSVGIAGKQTGIYPIDSPGGWQIIGRTPIKLFDIAQESPTLIRAGDQIKFYPISQKDFNQWENQPWEH